MNLLCTVLSVRATILHKDFSIYSTIDSIVFRSIIFFNPLEVTHCSCIKFFNTVCYFLTLSVGLYFLPTLVNKNFVYLLINIYLHGATSLGGPWPVPQCHVSYPD